MIVTESFKVHLSEADIYQLEDAYAEALLESEACCDAADEDGVYVWISVEIPPAAPAPQPRKARGFGSGMCAVFLAVVAVVVVGSMLCWELCCG